MTVLLEKPETSCGAIGRVQLYDLDHLTRMLDRPALEMVLDRFEALVTETVAARSGRLVAITTDGCAAYESENVDAALTIGLDIVERAGDDELLPDVRIRISSAANGPSVVLGALTPAFRDERAQNA